MPVLVPMPMSRAESRAAVPSGARSGAGHEAALRSGPALPPTAARGPEAPGSPGAAPCPMHLHPVRQLRSLPRSLCPATSTEDGAAKGRGSRVPVEPRPSGLAPR